jgi:hypothetical protein
VPAVAPRVRGVEHRAGALVLAVAPLADGRIGVVLQPAVGVGDVDAVEPVDDVVEFRRRNGRGQLPRLPALGFVPWLALDVRAFIFFFSVFFDIGAPTLRRAEVVASIRSEGQYS